jgi:hypothetical protein
LTSSSLVSSALGAVSWSSKSSASWLFCRTKVPPLGSNTTWCRYRCLSQWGWNCFHHSTQSCPLSCWCLSICP